MAQFQTDTMLRQWQILRMTPRYPQKITARDLFEKLQAEQFEVTKRTVERDLMALSKVFPLVSDEREKPYGWSWSKDAPAFSLPGLSPTEALTLAMVEQHLDALLPSSTLQQLQPYFKAAKEQLRNVPKSDRAKSWLNKVRTVPPTQPLLPPIIKPDVQLSVYEALLMDQQLEIKYLKRGQDTVEEYCIHPVALIQRGHVTYLYCSLAHNELRTLALHRIQSAIIRGEKAIVPTGLTIDDVIDGGEFGFGSRGNISLETIFYNGAGNHLYETPLTREQTLTELEDGTIKLVATLPNTPQLSWWILGFGDNIEVVQPKSLRKQIAETATKMQGRYQRVLPTRR